MISERRITSLVAAVQQGRVNRGNDWQYHSSGHIVDEALYEAERRGLVTLHMDGTVTATSAGDKWVARRHFDLQTGRNSKKPAEATAAPAVAFEAPTGQGVA
jgi:hypothetical protein